MRTLRWLSLLLLPFACQKKDSPRPKQPPVARFFLDSIQLEGENRLPSRFKLHWYGEDPDGYVVGYELRLNGGEWRFTTAQESTFVVSFQPGEQFKDVIFELRAVDNDGLRTEPPARLRVPLRNSPPECRIDPLSAPPETTLVAITISLQLSDPDGTETIDSLYVRIGQSGEWIRLQPRHTLLTFVPQNPAVPSPTLVYSGNNLNPLLTIPTPLPLDDTLRIYVRAKDQGGLFSATDSTRLIYLRRKTADWLVVSSWRLQDPVSLLDNDLRQAWGSYDYWSLARPTQRPLFQIPTWLHIFRAYPKVFWLGSVTELEELEEAEVLIERYLNGGGKLLVNFPLKGTIEPNSPIFRWAPIDSISTGERNGLLPPGGSVEPLVAGFPSLTNGLRTDDGIPLYISGINPPYPKSTAVTLYEMPALERGNGQPWPANQSRAAAVAFPTGTGRLRQIFFIIPLHQLDGNRVGFFSAVQNAFQP